MLRFTMWVLSLGTDPVFIEEFTAQAEIAHSLSLSDLPDAIVCECECDETGKPIGDGSACLYPAGETAAWESYVERYPEYRFMTVEYCGTPTAPAAPEKYALCPLNPASPNNPNNLRNIDR